MPRRSGGRAPMRSSVPARAPPPPPPAHPPQQQMMQQPKQPGMFAQMASTAAGVAVGSTVGHVVGGALFGGHGGGQQEAPPAPAPAAAPATYDQSQYYQAQAPQAPVCQLEMRQFLECAQTQGDITLCQGFNEALRQCKISNGLQI